MMVLGAIQFHYGGYVDNINTVNATGLFYSSGSEITGQPFDWADYLCIKNTIQIACSVSQGKIAIRIWSISMSTWDNWVSK